MPAEQPVNTSSTASEVAGVSPAVATDAICHAEASPNMP